MTETPAEKEVNKQLRNLRNKYGVKFVAPLERQVKEYRRFIGDIMKELKKKTGAY